MKRLFISFLALCLLTIGGLSVAVPANPPNEIYAIKNVKVVTGTGKTFNSGVIVMENGKITAVGDNVAIPRGAQVIDGGGAFAYPGMINANTTLGLLEIGSVAGSVDTAEIGDWNSPIRTYVAINAHSEIIPVTRVNGVTSVVAAPTGGIIAGQSVLYNLNGWTIEEMVVKPSVAMHMNLPSLGGGGGRRGGGGGGFPQGANANAARDQKMDELRKLLNDARAYAVSKEAEAKDPSLPRQRTNPVLENLIPVVNGTMPVIFHANREADIKAAIDFAAEMKLKPIICGASEAWKAAAYLKEKNVPVIYTGVFSLPGHEDDGYDVNYANAAALYKAGVKFCIATPFDAESDEFVRNLPYYAGQSAADGLPKDEGLRSVTLYPAQILGVGDKLGSIEEGKIGNIVLTDGDLLEYRTTVKQIFIAGKPVDMHNKHTDLYEKFINRP